MEYVDRIPVQKIWIIIKIPEDNISHIYQDVINFIITFIGEGKSTTRYFYEI